MINTMWETLRFSIIAILIYPFTTKWGIRGASFAILASIFISGMGFSYSAIKITGCEIKEFLKIVVPPLIGGVAMLFFVLAVKGVIDSSGIFGFLVCVGTGGAAYLCVAYLFERFLNYGLFSTIKGLKND